VRLDEVAEVATVDEGVLLLMVDEDDAGLIDRSKVVECTNLDRKAVMGGMAWTNEGKVDDLKGCEDMW
jgi:hypothetical protein